MVFVTLVEHSHFVPCQRSVQGPLMSGLNSYYAKINPRALERGAAVGDGVEGVGVGGVMQMHF